MAKVDSLLWTEEKNLTKLSKGAHLQNFVTKIPYLKIFLDIFVNCNKKCHFSNTQYPKIPDDSENISGRVRVLLEIIGPGIGYRVPVRHCSQQKIQKSGFPGVQNQAESAKSTETRN